MKSNRGAALLIVLVVFAVLIILGTVFAQNASQNFKVSRINGNIDYTYFAAESAIQKGFDKIYQTTYNQAAFAASCGPYTKDDAFVTLVIDKLQELLNASIDTEAKKQINIGDDITRTAVIETLKLQEMAHAYATPTLTITIGLTVQVSYNGFLNITEQKKVFAQKDFIILLPPVFELRGPVYTIGDLMIQNSYNNPGEPTGLRVLGDVHVYGTSPEISAQPQQYYYGGIYAKDKGTLEISGNAYSRSLIRTGMYESEDSSRIDITKDAITQGLQVFGNNDQIFVYRNAYTFDDVEMNGEDSIIAINGNYFGLSRGGLSHDDSSSVVNSSPIRFYTPEAKKSRIIINGNVMLNGGTFKIDPETGLGVKQIEDSSVAWLDITDGPLYKEWDPSLDGEYRAWVLSHYTKNQMNGFANLFQVWDTLLNPDKATIDTWYNNKVKNVILSGDNILNDGALVDNRIDPANNINAIPGIKGFCNYELAANNTMYFMDKDDLYSPVPVTTEIYKASSLENSFLLDNLNEGTYIDPITHSLFASWNNFWDNDVRSGGLWGTTGGYCENVPDRMDYLKIQLEGIINPFIKRMAGMAGNPITHSITPEFENLKMALTDFANASLSRKKNPYILTNNKTAVDPSDLNLQHLEIPVNGILPDTTDVTKGFDSTKSYLLINNDSNITLILDGKVFNGIIFSTGKVEMKNGAKVNGAIIAAGQGYEEQNQNPSGVEYYKGSAAEAGRTPIIKADGSNLYNLDNGDYAAILCTGNRNEINFPDIDGKTGRDEIIDKFKNQDTVHGLDLSSIFK